MSENSPDDDFFGIQCLSSSLDKSYESAEAVPEIQSSGKAAVAMRSRFSVKESAVEKDDSDLSGTEYLDRVFFPSIDDYDSEVAHSSEESAVDKIRRQFISVWKMSQDELVDLMVNRVLYKNDDIVAFDKPYGLAYSGASSSVPQLDRLLQKIKDLCDISGQNLPSFRNSAMQLALKEEFQNGQVEQVTRCIVRDELQDSPLKITIPLIKTVKNRDFKIHLPAISRLSAPIRICAPIPQHFVWMLKKLNLLKGFVIRVRIPRIPFENIDYGWEARVLYLFTKYLELERLMWKMSTLGGACSAMADYDISFARRAGDISEKQLRIAAELDDHTLLARCYLFIALSEAQQAKFGEARRILR
uniref:Vps16_C domain-containing protein n=1 Tax=Angiostrongylus cantonensis TaxID=6313 RepID=A0A0K0DCY5_ANGCA